MFEDLIFELEGHLKTTLNALTGFEEDIDNLSESLNPAEIQCLQGLFTDTCKSLTGILSVLNTTNSPLNELTNRLGPALLGVSSTDFLKLINSEKKLLNRIGLSESSVEEALTKMKDLERELVKATSILKEEEIIDAINDFKEIVCEIANVGEKYKKAINMEVVRVSLKGLVSVCVVTGDILSVFTVPDPTPFTFLRSIKSVHSGVISLKENTEVLRSKFSFFKEQIDTNAKLKAVRKHVENRPQLNRKK